TGTAIAVSILAGVLFLSIAFFFRNPVRHVPEDAAAVVSPADGTVRDIEVVDNFDLPPFEGKALRIGIFLSVLNVHVNRAPVGMKVENTHYREGEYLDARHAEATKRNEAMTISGTGTINGKTFPVAVRQISGAIARRIVCPVQAGQALKRGECYGMIKFGSRTELYLPAEGFEVKVKIGDKVRGCESVLARIAE
ncbi:MAG: phosphatidylserine decarboxylase, partial [Victivallaceae bacterium]